MAQAPVKLPIPSHMPFRTDQAIFFCSHDGDRRWKAYVLADGQYARLGESLNGDIECSPSGYVDEHGEWRVSLIIGRRDEVGVLRYALHELRFESLDAMLRKRRIHATEVVRTWTGFMRPEGASYVRNDGRRFHAVLPQGTLTAPGHACFYRLSYQSDAPHRILASVGTVGDLRSVLYDLQTHEQFEIRYREEPCYKASLHRGVLDFAHRCGKNFEDREVWTLEDYAFIPTDALEWTAAE